MPKWTYAFVGLLILPNLVNADSFDDALASGIQALQRNDFDTAIEQLTAAINLNPESARAHWARAFAFFSTGEASHAIADGTDAIRLDDKDPMSHKVRALGYLQTNQWDRAIADLKNAIQCDPRDISFYRHIGQAYTGKGDYPHALECFAEGLQRQPGDPYFLVDRGRMYTIKGDFNLALHDFDEVIRMTPTFVPAFIRRASLYRKKEDHEHCIADLRTALRLAPTDADALSLLAREWSTCSDDTVRQGKKAVQFAVRACILTNWKSASNWDTLAAAYAETGQFEEAAHCQMQAIENAPNDSLTEFKNRLALYQQKKPYRGE